MPGAQIGHESKGRLSAAALAWLRAVTTVRMPECLTKLSLLITARARAAMRCRGWYEFAVAWVPAFIHSALLRG